MSDQPWREEDGAEPFPRASVFPAAGIQQVWHYCGQSLNLGERYVTSGRFDPNAHPGYHSFFVPTHIDATISCPCESPVYRGDTFCVWAN